MPCYYPLTGYRSRVVNESGKRSIVFNPSDGFIDLKVVVPCGQCIGCRLEYSRQWAVRCVHEAQMHDASAFITLTYNDESLPHDRSVSVRELQLFFKRFRKAIAPLRIRFFACGEYGEKRQRPHYHACIFGYDFPDKIPCGVNKQGDTLYRSSLLESVWTNGFSTIGNVSFETCAYVARYMMKKVKGKDTPDFYEIVNEETGEISFQAKEFCTMSRGGEIGGIGASWFEMYGKSDANKDFITIRGKKMKLPKFYDMLMEERDPERFMIIKAERNLEAERAKEDNTYERLIVKEKVKKAKINLLTRDLE